MDLVVPQIRQGGADIVYVAHIWVDGQSSGYTLYDIVEG
jgi:hypothetical protein